MDNKFKIVIPSYNNQDWVEVNIESILEQTYNNYEVLYIDDCSTDNTREVVDSMVANNSKWKVITNEKNMRRGYNTAPKNIEYFFDDGEDILVFIDGDDWLPYPNVLEKLNQFYNQNDCWMTYGKMVVWHGEEKLTWPSSQNSEYSSDVHNNNEYRKDLWRASHLRTFKWHIYNQIKDIDLRYSKTDEYYFQAQDLATSFPCLEMCPKDKIGVLDFLSYVFNESKSNRERAIDRIKNAGGTVENGVTDLELEIRLIKKKYDVIQEPKFVTANLAGGLGNLLFEIANAYSFGLKHKLKCKFDLNHSLPMQGTKIHNYYDNIFKKIQFSNFDKYNLKNINQKRFEYDDYTYDGGNICFNGHFQSYKFFEEHEAEVRELFKCSTETKQYIQNKYRKFLNKRTVSIHVRRGDYVPQPENYILLDKAYYDKAFSVVSNKIDVILVFSDDIKWCKENFIGDNFIFVENEKDYIDLYLMSMCNHNIISNSSFSWWGAWLNQYKEKVVIAPKKWYGPNKDDRNLDDLLMSDWILI